MGVDHDTSDGLLPSTERAHVVFPELGSPLVMMTWAMSGSKRRSLWQSPAMDAGPLADLRVVDCSTLIAAPGCARYLADFGADVVKVERPGTGDSIRGLGWRHPADGETLWSKLENRNKRCVTLDLKSDDGKAAFLDLCDHANVLVENFRTGTLERLGLGPDVLHARNPGLVITRVSGFGQTGPYASRPGFATLLAP